MFKKRIFIGSFIKLSNTKFYTRIKKDFGGITTEDGFRYRTFT